MSERAVGQLAGRLAEGYYSHVAALIVAAHPAASTLMPGVPPGAAVPIGFVRRKDGSEHLFHFEHYLAKGSQPDFAADFRRAWPVGALLTLGDALQNHDYFQHAPELEMVYHLRNGAAHGNRFNLTSSGLNRLANYPAHTRDAAIRNGSQSTFEISPGLDGQTVLFDFMEAADVVDLLMSVQTYLLRIADGLPGHV
jgi:hypothetical protein